MAKTNKIIKFILIASVVLFVFSSFLKGTLPDKEEVLPQLYKTPKMSQTSKAPFDITRKGITYSITPLYNYELYGLIVAYHDARTMFDYYHGEWNDYLNTKDICVIWGDNIKFLEYKKVRFKAGNFTWRANAKCDVWSNFKFNCLSHNHLLNGSQEVDEIIRKAKRGDQIHLKGYLAKYSHSNGDFNRGSSTSLDDKGGKSCETVYVTNFKILESKDSFWMPVYVISKWLILFCLISIVVLWFASPVRIYNSTGV